MAGQILDTYIKVTAANLQQYVTNDVIHCNSVFARYAVQNGDAVYCNSVGTEIVPAWPPVPVSAVVENAAATDIVITFDMAMAFTDETGWSVLVDGVTATLHAVTPIAASGKDVTIKLASAITAGELVQVSYDASAGNTKNTGSDNISADIVNYKATNNVA